MGHGHATVNLIETPGYINEKQINLLQDIIDNKTVEISEEHKPSLQNFIGKKVMLYDKKRIRKCYNNSTCLDKM